MVTCLRLGTHSLFLVHPVEGEERHWLVSCICGSLVPCIRLVTLIYCLHNVEDELHYGHNLCEVHLRKVW